MVVFQSTSALSSVPRAAALVKCMTVKLTLISLVPFMSHLCLHGLQALYFGGLYSFKKNDKYEWILAKEMIASTQNTGKGDSSKTIQCLPCVEV